MSITDLPFNQFIGITVSARNDGALSLAAHSRYTNHLGTVHAAALLALAEAASGDYLIKALADSKFEVLPVVRRVEAKFRKPAYGAIYSTANVPPETRQEFILALSTKGRALITIPVDVHDDKGTHALTATIEWFVAKRSDGITQQPGQPV